MIGRLFKIGIGLAVAGYGVIALGQGGLGALLIIIGGICIGVSALA